MATSDGATSDGEGAGQMTDDDILQRAAQLVARNPDLRMRFYELLDVEDDRADGRRLSQIQQGLIVDVAGLRDQISKDHMLNVHFRAFEIASRAWDEHKRRQR